MKHKYLQQIGQLKLVRLGYWTVYPEVYAGFSTGVLDVVGAKRYLDDVETMGIEVKVSRADYFGKKQKTCDGHFKLTREMGVNYAYFLVPKGMISVDEVYEGWGLMTYDEARGNIKVIKKAPKHETDNTCVLFEMAQVPVYHYHAHVTKLSYGYKWVNYSDVVIEGTDQTTLTEGVAHSAS